DSLNNSWEVVGDTVKGTAGIDDMEIKNDKLYVAGPSKIGDMVVNRVAVYDISTNNWDTLGSALHNGGYISDIEVSDQGNVYIIGDFDQVGNLSTKNVARWNGNMWEGFNNGLWYSGATVADPACIELHNDSNFYVGGWFNRAGGNAIDNLAHWDGGQWNSIGNIPADINNRINDIHILGKMVLFSGNKYVNADTFKAVPQYDTSTGNWSQFGDSTLTSSDPEILEGGNGDIYLSESNMRINSNNIGDIAKWNGSNWVVVGDTAGNQLLEIGPAGNLYAQGASRNGNILGHQIAKWNGSKWTPFLNGYNAGMDNDVTALEVSDDGKVYAGGAFENAGGVFSHRIAVWDGQKWDSLKGGIKNYGVQAIEIAGNGDVFVGGSFTEVDGKPIEYLAKWDGSSWDSVGTGVDGEVRDIAFDSNGKMYVGGSFNN
ncbi:MAG: hypothetical protein ABEH43_08845, partial [Flavobacteriales bacterium]